MFKFIHTNGPYSDCMSDYDIELDKSYTVGEFIETVLKEKPKEWGYIGIYKKGKIFGDPVCEYRYEKLITEPLPEEFLIQDIKEIKASGGWSRMDYLIKLK